MKNKQNLITFPNKFKLILSGRDTRAVSIVVSITHGVENESARQSGITNLIERLISYDLADQVTRYGGELSTRSTLEHIEIAVSTIRENLPKLLTAISRSIFDFNPKLENFNSAKSRVIQKLENTKVSPTNILENLTLKNLYSKVGLSKPMGIINSVNNMTLEEVKLYMSKVIGPNTLNLAIVGDIADNKTNQDNTQNVLNSDYEEVYALVMEKFYAKLIDYKDPKPKYSNFYQNIQPQYIEKSKILHQDRFEIAFPTASYSSTDYKYTKLISNYLSTYIKKQAMGRKNVYGLDIESFAYRNNGHIRVQFAVDSEDAIEVYENTLSLLKNVKIQSVTNGEFEALKKIYISRVIFRHETTLSLAKRYSKWIALKDELFDLDTEIDSINSLSYIKFKEVLNNTLNFSKISVARVGRKRPNFLPFKNI